VSEETLRQSRRQQVPTSLHHHHPGNLQISPQDLSAMFPNLPTTLASLMSAGLPSLTAGLASSALAHASRTPSSARAAHGQQHGTPLPPPPLSLAPPSLSSSSETPIRPKPLRTPSNNSDMTSSKMNPSFSLPPGIQDINLGTIQSNSGSQPRVRGKLKEFTCISV
jgi:hypothetical protein